MKNKLKQIAASILTLALLAVPVLAAAESVGSNSLNVADGTVYTYSTQAVTSDSGKQTNLHENIFTYKKEAQVRPVVAFGTTLYGTRTVLCHLFWRYDVTAEQLFYMFNISLKYFVALPVAILFISATDPSEFAASLNSIGVSYKIGYSVAIALRYIPDIQRDYHSISQAQQARGVELGRSEPFFKRLKNSVNILLPLILTSLNRIDVISNAMELRGFGKGSKRTWYVRRPFARRDFIALAFGVVLLLVSLTVTIKFGRFYNPFV